MLHFRYQKSKSSKEQNKKQPNAKRKLRNQNLDQMLKSSETLLEDYIEFEVQYIGKLKCVPSNVDITVKKTLLQQMKEAQNQNYLPKVLTHANVCILRLNAFILELLTRETEELIMALPVHSISNVCYAKETETSHIIAIQSGSSYTNNEYFEVNLLIIKSKNEAEIVCELLKKCFELLYIERTMSLLDMVIGDDTVSNFSTSVSCVNNKITSNKTSTVKIKNIDDVKSMVSMSIDRKRTSSKEVQQSEIRSLNESAYETIEEFIVQLKQELNKNEYENFGMALTEWQRGQPFERFCLKALQIVGKNRIHILIAMKPFVPIENLEWFKTFIKKNDPDKLHPSHIWSSDSSLESNSDAESTLSHYFSEVINQRMKTNP